MDFGLRDSKRIEFELRIWARGMLNEGLTLLRRRGSNDESKIQNPKSKIGVGESKIQNLKSKIPTEAILGRDGS